MARTYGTFLKTFKDHQVNAVNSCLETITSTKISTIVIQ